jgi:hypothetical protein
MIDRRDYIYQVYFYSDGKILFLEDSLIFDINLSKSKNSKEDDDTMIIDFSDFFFEDEFSKVNTQDFIITAQVFNKDTGFIQQIELLSESVNICANQIIVIFDSININKAWSSINPNWTVLAESYKSKRVSTLRINAIETLLK